MGSILHGLTESLSLNNLSNLYNIGTKGNEVLDAINKKNKSNFIMTYSYGRALQQSALKHWSKNTDDIEGTQKIFNHRANMCSLAAKGKWSEQVEKN